MSIYLVTYCPLNINQSGCKAMRKHNLPPYIDGGCRREPDLQSAFPSISAVCRAGKFAPRLKVGDTVVYITFLDRATDAWRMTAILEVREWFKSHEDAAAWYRNQGLPLPSNCLVKNNDPLPLDHTHSLSDECEMPMKPRGCQPAGDIILRDWDESYQKRVRNYPMFLRCEALYPVDLYNPPILTREDVKRIFGKMPSTRNPRNGGNVSSVQLEALKREFVRQMTRKTA